MNSMLCRVRTQDSGLSHQQGSQVLCDLAEGLQVSFEHSGLKLGGNKSKIGVAGPRTKSASTRPSAVRLAFSLAPSNLTWYRNECSSNESLSFHQLRSGDSPFDCGPCESDRPRAGRASLSSKGGPSQRRWQPSGCSPAASTCTRPSSAPPLPSSSLPVACRGGLAGARRRQATRRLRRIKLRTGV